MTMGDKDNDNYIDNDNDHDIDKDNDIDKDKDKDKDNGRREQPGRHLGGWRLPPLLRMAQLNFKTLPLT